jgi:hypothetical protein
MGSTPKAAPRRLDTQPTNGVHTVQQLCLGLALVSLPTSLPCTSANPSRPQPLNNPELCTPCSGVGSALCLPCHHRLAGDRASNCPRLKHVQRCKPARPLLTQRLLIFRGGAATCAGKRICMACMCGQCVTAQLPRHAMEYLMDHTRTWGAAACTEMRGPANLGKGVMPKPS